MTSAIERLEKEAAKCDQFSAEELNEIHRMISAYRGWMALGALAKIVIAILAGVSVIVIASGHLKTGLKAWLG